MTTKPQRVSDERIYATWRGIVDSGDESANIKDAVVIPFGRAIALLAALAEDQVHDGIENRMRARAQPFEAFLTEDDFHDLNRFIECAEDSDSGGHDVPKERMRRLTELGVVRSCGFGRHESTSFGEYLRKGIWLQNPSLPLRTIAEYNKLSTIAANQKVEKS